MAVINQRMTQRVGKESELASVANALEGEIFITTDTKEMYFYSGNEMNKVPTMDDIGNIGGGGGSTIVEDSLTSQSKDNALSANKGRELNERITNLTNQVATNTANISKKQDIIIHKSNQAPGDTSLIWFDTNPL